MAFKDERKYEVEEILRKQLELLAEKSANCAISDLGFISERMVMIADVLLRNFSGQQDDSKFISERIVNISELEKEIQNIRLQLIAIEKKMTNPNDSFGPSTKWLVDELKERVGVKAMIVKPYGKYQIVVSDDETQKSASGTGPAVLLEVTD